jgi:shikimate kinase
VSSRPDEPIWVVGAPGSGKSTVGGRLAHRLGRPFADLDRLIEAAAGRTIAEIFSAEGEATFRRLESAALARVLDEVGRTAVVACGGGIVSRKANRDRLAATGVVLWLDVPASVARKRCASETGTRPLLSDSRFFTRTLARRLPQYRSLGRRIDADAPPEVVVERAVRALAGPAA